MLQQEMQRRIINSRDYYLMILIVFGFLRVLCGKKLSFFLQRVLDHLVYGIHEDELHLFAQVLGHVFDVILVLLREE